jgi:hypothetical protein
VSDEYEISEARQRVKGIPLSGFANPFRYQANRGVKVLNKLILTGPLVAPSPNIDYQFGDGISAPTIVVRCESSGAADVIKSAAAGTGATASKQTYITALRVS